MCLAIPAEVIEVEADHAKVTVLGNTLTANLALIEEVGVGDYVLLHAGFAIEKLSAEEAAETLDMFRELGEQLEEETG